MRAPGCAVIVPGTSHESQPATDKGSHTKAAAEGGGARILRATFPASQPTQASSLAPASSVNHAQGTRHTAVITKRSVNAQWHSPRPKTDSGPISSHLMARLAPHDAQSKRPVSPAQNLPLVRRRLAKRSRQDGQGHGQLLEGQGPEGEAEQGADENVTVERLVTSPDCRVTTKTPVSQSGASNTARDLHALPAISAVSNSH